MISSTKYLDIKNCAQDYVMLIAMLLAYVCLLRKSEYLDEATSDHYLRADDVWFEVEFTLGTAKLIQVPSTDRHKQVRSQRDARCYDRYSVSKE